MTVKRYAQFDTTTGQITQMLTLSASAVPLNEPAGFGLVLVPDKTKNDANIYIDLTDPQNPVVADRPVWNPFPATSAAPLVVDITDAPAGTSLTVADEGGEVTTVSDFTQPLTFVDAGGYTVSIAPPFPYQVITQKVTAT